MASSGTGPERRSKGASGYIVAVLVTLVVALALVFFTFGFPFLWSPPWSPPPPPPSDEIVFSPVSVDAGRNASWVVSSVVGGPYPYSGFSIRLTVNATTMNWVLLGRNDTIRFVQVASTTYRVVWRDADGNGLVSEGDPFSVTGDETPLPSLSTIEFGLKWMESWISEASWSTS
jgi:hypothetical protein